MKYTAMLLCTASLIVPIACADDFASPWYRDKPGSVFAEWNFTTIQDNMYDIHPSQFSHVKGSGMVLYTNGTTHAELSMGQWQWVDTGLKATTFFDIAFKVQNFIDTLPKKFIRIQITYTDTTGTDRIPLVLSCTTMNWGGEIIEGQFIQNTIVSKENFFEDWIILPNPDWESISLHVPEGIILQQVVIDTITIPEPASLSLISLGLLAFVRRKR